MEKTIMIIGAGPGIGLHVAKKFGKEGFHAALIARTQTNLDACVERLAEEGIEAVGFPADVRDLASLNAAIARAQDRFKTIDVLEYSPVSDLNQLVTPRNITVENTLPQLGYTLGAIAAVRAVLPGMLKQGDGGILFVSAASAIEPVPFSANFAISQSGIRSYAHSLHNDLKKDGIYVGMLLIAGLVDREDGSAANHPPPPLGQQETLPFIKVSSIAEAMWKMYAERKSIDKIVGDINVIYNPPPSVS